MLCIIFNCSVILYHSAFTYCYAKVVCSAKYSAPPSTFASPSSGCRPLLSAVSGQCPRCCQCCHYPCRRHSQYCVRIPLWTLPAHISRQSSFATTDSASNRAIFFGKVQFVVGLCQLWLRLQIDLPHAPRKPRLLSADIIWSVLFVQHILFGKLFCNIAEYYVFTEQLQNNRTMHNVLIFKQNIQIFSCITFVFCLTLKILFRSHPS